MNIKTTLLSAATLLNTEEAALEVQLLLQHVLNVNRAWLIAHEGDALQANSHAVFEALLKRRLNGEPMAYILGYREFYGLKLKVTPDTLIPRPDTETLVEAALAKVQLSPLPRGERGGGECVNAVNAKASPSPQPSPTLGGGSFNVLDLGTGTGAIALVIAKHCPQTFVTAVDASDAALKIAQENAQNLAITNIEFVQSDWFSALKNQCFDMIVSNPPYIEQNDAHLQQGDLRFEPLSALASGIDGLNDIKQIITQAPNHLNPHGCLLLEHGYNQALPVAALLKQAGFSQIETIKDLGGNDRVTLGFISQHIV